MELHLYQKTHLFISHNSPTRTQQETGKHGPLIKIIYP